VYEAQKLYYYFTRDKSLFIDQMAAARAWQHISNT